MKPSPLGFLRQNSDGDAHEGESCQDADSKLDAQHEILSKFIVKVRA